MKIKKMIAITIVLVTIFAMFVCMPKGQAVFDINLTIRNGKVYVNDQETDAIRTATFVGAPYIPLNIVAPKIPGMLFENKQNGVVAFSYKGNNLTIDFNKKNVLLNGSPYTLLYGVSKMTVLDKQHIFLGNTDIQNIFGLITEYDESTYTTRIYTGFGVLSVDYSQQGGYQTEANMAYGRAKFLSYANNIASASKSTLTEIDKTNVESVVNKIFDSINAPITRTEFENGIRIDGLSYKNTNSEDLSYIMNTKFLAALANITVYPEYIKVYEIKNQRKEMYLVGVFFAYEGLDISNNDLITAAVATIEDTLNATLNQKLYNDVAKKIKTIADTLRKDNKILVFCISGSQIEIADLI